MHTPYIHVWMHCAVHTRPGLTALNLFFARRNKFQSPVFFHIRSCFFFFFLLFNMLTEFAMSFSLFLTLSLLHNIFP